MAVFSHIRTFQGAKPLGFRPEAPRAGDPSLINPQLVGSWSADSDGSLTWRWRVLAAGTAH